MNWGILTLLATIVAVLAAFVAFFVYLARKAATAANPQPGRASVPASPDFLRSPGKLGLARTLALPTRTEPILESTRPAS